MQEREENRTGVEMQMVACESWKICQTAFNASSISCNATHAQNDYAKSGYWN